MHNGNLVAISVFYCATSSVATNSGSCTSEFTEQAGTLTTPVAATHTGAYPSSGANIWSASRSIHGVAYSAVRYRDSSLVWHYDVANSREVFW